MRRALVLVEGPTEERFVKGVLQPYLWQQGVHLEPKILVTSRTKQGRQFKGGVSSFDQIKRDLRNLLHDSNAVIVTTMLDYYGLPDDFPGLADLQAGTPQTRVHALEGAFLMEIGAEPRFKPFLMLHEFEALLFVAPEVLAEGVNTPTLESGLRRIRDSFPTPEDINDGVNTHPSRRIVDLFPAYKKPLHGTIITQRIGLQALRNECPHFNEWVTLLENVDAQAT